MSLESRYADGQLAALTRLKFAFPAATHPVVQQSAVLQSQAPKQMSQQAQERMQPPTTPFSVSQLFDVHEQAHTRTEPMRKLSNVTVIDDGMIPHILGHAARGGLLGGALGAVAPSEDHSLRNALIGATLGAGISGGLGAFRRTIDNRGAVDRLMHKFKLSADNMCTSCRKERHYGTCARPVPIKRADFNAGMHGNDPSAGNNPSMSPHYHSATSADSALARSRDGRPADEQAGTYFADLFRANGGGLNGMTDEPGRMTGDLNKVADAAARLRASPRRALLDKMFGLSQLLPKVGGWQLWGTDGHSTHEDRGPTPNPYEERLTRKSPPVGFGDEGAQRIRRAFDQVDGAADSTSIEGGFGTPSGGPAVLG